MPRKGRRAFLQTLSVGVPTSAPTAAMGWREWWNPMDATTLFTDAGTTPVSSNNDPVYQMNGTLGVVASSEFVQATAANRPLYKTGGAGGKTYLQYDTSNDYMESLGANNFLAVGAKTIVIAMTGRTGWATTDRIICDRAEGYWHIDMNAGPVIQMTHYDGSFDVSTGVSFTADTPLVYAFKHSGGNMYDAKNSINWGTAVASGNTSKLTNPLNISNAVGSGLDVYSIAIANVVIADSDILAVVNYFKQQLGI